MKKTYLGPETNALNKVFVDGGSKVMATYRFPNGNVSSFGYNDQQVPMLQGVYSKELEDKIRKHSDERTRWEGF
jgi:hypothetical protein